jgi:Lrp/AsnC family transcriptional regulator for asnA, asnC and gidA
VASDDTRGQLDDVERRMVVELQHDGRITTQEIARRVGISETTARKKLRRLIGERIVQIAARIDPFQFGFETPATIGLKVDRDRIDEVALALCENPHVRWVAASTGRYDLLIEFVGRDNRDLAEFLLGDLTRDGIRATETCLLLKIYKQTWDYGVRGTDHGVDGADVADSES